MLFLCTLGLLLITTRSSLALELWEVETLIPTSFPQAEVYTTRYLSQLTDGGFNSQACLQLENNSTQDPVHCHSVRYSLTGQSVGTRFSGIRYLILLVSPGVYSYGQTIALMDSSNIIIARNPLSDSGEAIFRCENISTEFNNLFFQDVENVALIGLTFSHCGPRSPGIGIDNVTNAIFKDCIFKDNINSGAVVYQSSNVVFMDSLFEDNSAASEYNVSDPNVVQTFDFRRAAGLTISYIHGSKSNYALVRNCTFRNNLVNVSEANEEDVKHRPSLYIPRGHGGALLIYFQSTVKHRVEIENCTFAENLARFTGGAMSVQFFRGSNMSDPESPSSRDNTVVINDTVFQNNWCEGAGGAISVNTFEASNYNEVAVTNSVFEGNVAKREGGACSFIIEDNLVEGETTMLGNIFSIGGSDFLNNSSPHGGSAVSLESNARVDQATTSAEISDCTFIGNQAGMRSALLSLRYPLVLKGTNIFQGNQGGAVTLTQAHMDTFGSIRFEGNTAESGGAVTLLDKSTMDLGNDTEMVFRENKADEHGGAINVLSTPLIGDIREFFATEKDCFFLHSSAKVSVEFIDNKAGKEGAAIYATDFISCTPRRALPLANGALFALPSILTFRDNITNGTRAGNLATEPYRIKITPHKNVTGAPGQVLRFKITAVDQNMNQQQAFWSIEDTVLSLNANGSWYDPEVQHLDADKFTDEVCLQAHDTGLQLERRNLTFNLIRAATGDIISQTNVSLSVTCCHPGYELRNGVCMHETIEGIDSRPDEDKKYFHKQGKYYAKVRNGSIIWATIPVTYQRCTSFDCLFKYDAPDDQCAANRRGFACGRCPNGTQLDLTLAQCVECEQWHIYIITAIVLAFAVVCALVMIFNISVPNELRGILFYVQVVGFVYGYSEKGPGAWDHYLASMFRYSLYIPLLCPYPGYDALHTAAFGYLLPLVAIITIIIYIICARFIKRLSNKNSFDGIWFLTFIIYKYTADTCFRILRCQRVNGGNQNEYVYYYTGDIKCFDLSAEGRPFMILAVFALILSIAIIIFPIVILVISFKRFKFTVNITDVLNKSLKVTCRWWASFDLFRRLLYVTAVLVFSYLAPGYRQLAMFYTGLFVLFVFAYSHPYTSKAANVIETLVLLNLLMVTALNFDLSVSAHKPFALLLLLLPFMAATVYCSLLIFSYIWSKYSPMSLKTLCIGLLCKLMKRIGVKLPFLRSHLECVAYHPSTDIELSHTNSVDHEWDVKEESVSFDVQNYVEYREELLQD